MSQQALQVLSKWGGEASLSQRTTSDGASDEDSPVNYKETLLVSRWFSVPVLVTFTLWIIFMCSLPFLSWYFNDHLEYFNHRYLDINGTTGPANYLCMTPAEEMVCSDGSDFAKLPVIQKRMNISGRRNVGCGCSQGVIGESACSQDGTLGYTLSSFISPAPAAAAFVGLAMPAQLSMWWLASVVVRIARPNRFVEYMLYLSLLAFNIAFTTFGFGTDCIFLDLHLKMTKAYLWLALIYNALVLAIVLAYGACKSNVTLVMTVSISVALFMNVCLGGIVAYLAHALALVKLSVYAFFVFELLVMVFVFSPAPILLVFAELPVADKAASSASASLLTREP